MSGMDIRALIENDDDFVARIAAATGIRTWADSGDLWDIDESNVDQVKVRDEEVREKAIEALRDQLLEAFEGYELAAPHPVSEAEALYNSIGTQPSEPEHNNGR
jgi:hypothetical protein